MIIQLSTQGGTELLVQIESFEVVVINKEAHKTYKLKVVIISMIELV